VLQIEKIKEELTSQFPEYSFFLTRRLTGRCIVAKHTKFNGADIFVRKDRIIIEACIPEWRTRLMIGAGAVYRKFPDKHFFDTALRIKDFLDSRYAVSLRN
jgi:hypothetical protein